MKDGKQVTHADDGVAELDAVREDRSSEVLGESEVEEAVQSCFTSVRKRILTSHI